MDRLEIDANTVPTITLIELRNAPNELKDKKAPFSFLRSLTAEIQGARYQKDVMPFVVLTFDESPQPETNLDSAITTTCLQAGAVDILQSPLRHEDINRMIGHFKEQNRPPARLVGAPMAQNLVDSIHNVSKPPRSEVYRPDEKLSAERKAVVEDAIYRWRFPAQDFNMDELTYAALYMLEHLLRSPELHGYGLERPQLVALLLATRRQYKHEREVHYHNWRHAVDVAQSIFCFLLDLRLCPPFEADERRHGETTAVERLLSPLDGLILLVSAIGHDVGHPGVNNAFLVACNHPLAQTYNDKSVLENYHCAAYQQLLRRHWPSLGQIAGFRATMISTILATDMQRHFEYMSSLGELMPKVQNGEPKVDDWNKKDRENTRELIMALLIKAADISNVARPFDIAAKWARILMYEFARQGELESELQIPTCLFGGPPDTEDVLAAAQSQQGFMSLFGLPLFQGIAEILPCLSSPVRELESNQHLWDQRINYEKRRREPEDAEERPHFSSVTEEEVEEAQAEHRKSEPTAVPLQAVQSLSSPTKRVKVESPETSPSRHAAHDLRQQLASGVARDDDKHSSAPLLGSPSGPQSPTGTSPSRRSSKDIALDHMQQLNAFTHQSPSSGSRRGSADAGWQIHQSYPSSRRGSKDESLTTILVTSGSSPNRRSSPSSPGKRISPPKSTSKRQSVPSSQKAAVGRAPALSPRSQATGIGTASTTQCSPSTHPYVFVPEDETTPPAALTSIPSTEDPFMLPTTWPNDVDGSHRASIHGELAEALPSTPPPPPKLDMAKAESTQISTREADDAAIMSPKPLGDSGLRESRSRSRLRGLKFWKKRRDITGVEATEPPSGSP